MSASDFLEALTQGCFVLIALVVARAAVRQPTPARLDIAAFFGVTTVIIVQGWLRPLLGFLPRPLLSVLPLALLLILPYILIRLVNDFATVPPLIMRGAALGLGLAIIGLIWFSPALPIPLVLLLALYFFGGNLYVAGAFWRAAATASGVTRRRLHAVAAGSGLLGLSILALGLGVALPPAAAGAIRLLYQGGALAAVISYFLGFAPPALLRRAWQEPELRAFIGRASRLPHLPDTAAIVQELEDGAQAALGATRAVIGLWDAASGTLRYVGAAEPLAGAADQFIGGRAFTTQRPVFSANAPRDDPQHAARYRAAGATAILAAPITANAERLGVLVAFATRAPIFAEEDLQLLQLLADQAAVILESRALLDEAGRVRARAEATRLKDDFLSAAAHDLKTPLTKILGTAQLLERRAARRPGEPTDPAALARIVGDALHLRAIMIELLDVARAEQGALLGRREPVDLAELARATGVRHASARHRVLIDAPEQVIGTYDRTRITQLLDNLIENAVKYSPAGGTVDVSVRGTADRAEVTVADHGIGIPPADLPHLFERFHRGANVDDRQFAGMGLGLYICRSIVEEHAGQIRASSVLGQGSTFQVTLPRRMEIETLAPERGTYEPVSEAWGC